MIYLKKMKKAFSMLMLGVILLSVLLPSTASAFPLTAMRISFTPDKLSYSRGDMVQLSFSLDDIQMYSRNGLASAAFTVEYDSAVLEAPESFQEGVNYSTPLPGEHYTVNTPSKLEPLQGLERIRISVAGVSAGDLLSGTQKIVTLQFRVKDDATGFGSILMEPDSAHLVDSEGSVLNSTSPVLLYQGGGIRVTASGIDTFALNGFSGVIDDGTNGFGTITVTVPYGTKVTDMVATFTAVGEVTIGKNKQESGVNKNDFTNPKLYMATVDIEDFHSYVVKVEVAPAGSHKAITSFTVGGNTGVIDEVHKTISIQTSTPRPWLLAPTFTATGVSVEYNHSALTSGHSLVNFETPATLTVIAEDGSAVDYVVTVTAQPSSTKELTSFSVANINAAINPTSHAVNLTVPFGTDLSALTPAFAFSGAKVEVDGIQQISGQTAVDFTVPRTYTIVAEDESAQDYLVTVTVAPASSEKALHSVTVGGVAGTIDEATHSVYVTVPSSTDLSTLTLEYDTSAAAVQVNAGEFTNGEKHDFSKPTMLKLIAEDHSFADYSIQVTKAQEQSNDKALLTYSIGTAAGSIDADKGTVNVEVPAGTDLTNLIAQFTILGTHLYVGETEQVSNVTPNDFTRPVTYNLHAEDHTVKAFVVTVTVAASTTPTPTPASTPSPTSTPASTENNSGSNDGKVTPVATKAPLSASTVSPAPAATPAAVEIKYADKAKLKEVLSKATTALASTSLTDVAPNWASSDIKLLESAGIIKGYTDKTFRPNGEISRAEFATILWRILGEPASTAPAAFPDVQADWSAQAIAQLTQLGIINGYGDGTFRPDASISRAEMVTLLMRMLNSNIQDNSESFPDIKGNWAESNISKAKSLGIIQGADDSAFNPTHNVTRAEAASMLVRALKLDAELKVLLDPQIN